SEFLPAFSKARVVSSVSAFLPPNEYRTRSARSQKSGATALPANPYNHCEDRSFDRVNRTKQACTSALILPVARPCAADSQSYCSSEGFGGDYTNLILTSQTISDSNDVQPVVLGHLSFVFSVRWQTHKRRMTRT